MKKELASAAAAAALMIMSQSSTAHVASIDGCYDCAVYDTPTLTFHNTSLFDFTNVQITLTISTPATANGWPIYETVGCDVTTMSTCSVRMNENRTVLIKAGRG